MPRIKQRNWKITDIPAFARAYPKLVEHIPASYRLLRGKIDGILENGVDLEGVEFVDQEALPQGLKQKAV